MTSEAASSARGTRTRAEHLGPERRRPLVLDAARTVYLQGGYDGTSMDAIAKEAGVTKPVLYDCYPNKQQLFTALLQREAGRLLEDSVRTLPAEVNVEHPDVTMRLGFSGFLTSVQAHPESFRVVTRAVVEGLDADLSKGLDAHREQITSHMRKLALAFLTAQGSPEPARYAEISGHAMFAIGDAFARLLVNQPDAFDAEELADAAVVLLLRGLEGLTGIVVSE